MHSSVVCTKGTNSCSYHPDEETEQLHPAKPSWLPQMCFAFFWTLKKWGCTIYTPCVWLLLLNSMSVKFIQMLHIAIVCSFSLLKGCHCMDIPPLFILLLMNIWVVSTFGLYAQCCYEYSSHLPFDEHMYSNIPKNKSTSSYGIPMFRFSISC